MHAAHAVFLDAIAAKRRLSVRFHSKKLGREVVRVCAPLDFGPLRGAIEPVDHYQLWDLEGRRKPLNIPLLESEIVSMTALDETFDPASIITWNFKPGAWRIARDWGELS
ncbi:MAG: hypothetical protein KF850_02855 [Labilithrix sp.]|nr:hypothetical protein [Labilithrix sp.]